MSWRVVVGGVVVLSAGCDLGGQAVAIFDAGPPRSRAAMAPLQGTSVTGEAVFTQDIFTDGTITLVVTLSGVIPEGVHGIHIHETPDCSAIDGTSAGEHWNPLGGPLADPPVPLADQLGELGNVTITGGRGTLTLSKPRWTFGDGAATDVIGRAVILHRDPDMGPRIACGVTAPMVRI